MTHSLARLFSVCALVSLTLIGCAPRLLVHVKAYTDPQHPPTVPMTFQTVAREGCAQDALLEKNLLQLVVERLVQKGLTMNTERPGALVSVCSTMNTVQDYVPPSTRYETITSTSNTEARIKGDGPEKTKQESTTTYTVVPVTQPGYYVTTHEHHLDLLITTPPKTRQKGSAVPIWSGAIDTQSGTTDPLVLAPLLLDELFGEFPTRSGRPSTRVIKWASPKAH